MQRTSRSCLSKLLPIVWILAALLVEACSDLRGRRSTDWPAASGGPGGQRYSALGQINRTNVQRLRAAWTFEMAERGDPETTPIIVDGTLFAYTPELAVIALDARTGHLIWRFSPERATGAPRVAVPTGPSRGLAYWSRGRERRLLAGIRDRLYALDPDTGQLIDSFGSGGSIDLRSGLRGDGAGHSVFMTSPGIIYDDLIIVGFRTLETHPAPPGDIRAFDVVTGKLRWSFHTIPHPGEAGYETWPTTAWQYAGAANNWVGFALDEQRGIVYAPTGSAVYDFYGGDRPGDNLYANTLLALDARTGRRLWHFQGVHHDLWDRDFASPPTLVSVSRGGKQIDAVAQLTKQGFLFLLNRVDGSPLFPIAEMPVRSSEVPGEESSPTQPAPALPAPFARQRLTRDELTQRTPGAHDWALAQFARFRSEGPYTPFGLDRPTVLMPGFDGGAEWGGAAVDPKSAVLYVNSNDIAWTGQLAETALNLGEGATTYMTQCAMCHGVDRRGAPPEFPSLSNLSSRLSVSDITAVINGGRGRMPPFPNLEVGLLENLVSFLLAGTDPARAAAPGPDSGRHDAPPVLPGVTTLVAAGAEGRNERYAFTGYKKFLDPDGYPAVAPPWGTLNAIDLNTGQYLWTVQLGYYPELAAQGLDATGTENYGGPIVTAGGLVFIAATIYDRKFRAFDSASGLLLWEHDLPYAGTATPATYMVDGRQYIVVCTNATRDRRARQGSAYVAFALP